MALPWEDEIMNFFMAASAVQRVLVQKVLRRSRRNLEARLPSARVAWREERKAYHANIGKKRQERRRRRVMETKGISQWYRRAASSMCAAQDAQPKVAVPLGSFCTS